jgi:hypothetical protein
MSPLVLVQIPVSIVTRILRLTLERIAARLLLACLGYIELWNIDETRLSKAQVRLRYVEATDENIAASRLCMSMCSQSF